MSQSWTGSPVSFFIRSFITCSIYRLLTHARIGCSLVGGGVGLSMHAPFRVATERTQFAMPETDIGYFTDVGATHFLSNMDGHLGTYLGLTSSRVTGRQALYVRWWWRFFPFSTKNG